MKIRTPRNSDAEGLARLYQQFWELHKTFEEPLLKFERKHTFKDHLKDARETIKKKEKYIFVAEDAGKIVGYIHVQIRKNLREFKVKQYGYLDSAATLKEFRGKGIAKALTAYAMNFLKKKGIVYVRAKVDKENDVALKVWKKLGFKVQNYTILKKL